MVGTLAALPYLLLGKHASAGILATGIGILALSAVLLWLAVWLGGRACKVWPLRTPWLDALLGQGAWPADTARQVRRSLLLGLAVGTVTLLLASVLPPLGDSGARVRPAPAWAELLSALFGGITEEIYLIWCVLPVSAVILRALLRLQPGAAHAGLPPALFWTANALAALVLGILHLPGVLGATTATAALVLQTLLLYGAPGLVYGWLFRRSGLEMAMLAHLVADLCLHASQVMSAG